ncbi:MAG TPA: hypothetical protein VFV85_02655, partial [Conexibacter sp.]|nr:hypothetical protein [Conexibacter sp.]
GIRGALALAGALALLVVAPLAPARADQAYDKVAQAYAQAGGHLEPCQFTQAQLEAAVRGIPPAIRNVVPALRAAMVEGIAAHVHGSCKGKQPEEAATGGASAGTVPPVTTAPPATSAAPAATVPTTTQPAPAGAAPAATTTTPTTAAPSSATTSTHRHDRTPLLVALVALGALVLLALLLWGWARLRGWDPRWAARTRHAWGEAGFRTSSTWSEFTDWLRLGR